MKLFEVFPERFFHLLTGLNKHLYAETVLLLFEQSQQERFGIRYDVMRDLIQELIETHNDLGIEIDLQEEEEDKEKQNLNAIGTRHDNSRDQQMTLEEVSRTQANQLLRRLQDLKWIDVEIRDQFEQYIILPHYSSRVLGLFQELCEARSVEYQRFAFVTYEILTGKEAKRRPCFAIREALQYTLQFEQELITLYNNMKHHMEQVVQAASIQDVLDHHFDVYKSQIVDNSYHRLKTSDHVSRYRFQILQTVQQWLLDKELLEETIEDGLKNDYYPSRDKAEEDVCATLYRIEETYSGLDEIFYQIDIRHNQYLRSSYDRARYLSQQQQGMDQKLANLLEIISTKKREIPVDPFPWPELFRMQQSDVLTEGSLYAPRRKRMPHQPAEHVIVPISEELKQQLRNENLERMRQAITRKKVDDYVLDRLGDRSEMDMEELAPATIEQFLLLTYVYLYGQDGASDFGLKRTQERRILQIGQYRFSNHRIIRKRGKTT